MPSLWYSKHKNDNQSRILFKTFLLTRSFVNYGQPMQHLGKYRHALYLLAALWLTVLNRAAQYDHRANRCKYQPGYPQ